MVSRDTPQDGAQERERFLARMDGELAGWPEPAMRLRDAIDHDHFRLYAQPIVALAPEGDVTLFEVLVRLREEEALMLPPGEFLPAFEHYGMLVELDRWVLRHGLRYVESADRATKFSINVSAQTLADPAFLAFAAVQLRLAGVAPERVVFELEERDVLERADAVRAFAEGVRAVGCGLLVDGFARRAVSFEPLVALRSNYVKVDGTVVRNVLRSRNALAKLRAIVRVGAAIGIGVIAECVEEGEVLAAVREAGVGFAQGFGIGPAEPIERALERRRCRR